MIQNRRPRSNFALQRAAELAREQGRPLVVLEPLRAGYRWASDRFHAFVLEGMCDNRAYFDAHGILYYPYVEPEPGAGKGLLEAFARRAAVVITDDWPCFFLPRMVAAAGRALDVRLELVDSCGLLPIHSVDRAMPTAHAFRRLLQRELPAHFTNVPLAEPVEVLQPAGEVDLPADLVERWPSASDALLEADPSALAELPIDHDVVRVAERGGFEQAARRVDEFVARRLGRYEERNQPELEVTSGLSPHLHFGHVSSHEVFLAVTNELGWSPSDVASTTNGSRSGWWNLPAAAEGFLDQLVTWRELGFNGALRIPNATRYESLPDWARKTLAEHASDPRGHVYDLGTFERAATHDELWDAAQTQLVREGWIHNYLRMLWGKKVIEWTASPEEALAILIELNNKYALDGRDPNSYSGIFWVLGRYDRAWGPERPIFGKIRYMTSQNTARKVRVKDYLKRYAPAPTEATLFDDGDLPSR